MAETIRNLLAILVFVIALVGGFVRAVAGPPPAIKIHVGPFAGFAPAKIHVDLHVIPVDSDRRVRLVIDGPDYYSSNEWDASIDRRSYGFDFPRVPSGYYDVTALIGNGSGGVRAMDHTNVTVLSGQ